MKHRIRLRRRDGIRQRYWKNYNSIPFSEAKLITLYHGTNKEKAKKILKEGLNPNSFDYVSKENAVFLTPSRSAAVYHALIGPESEYDEKLKPIKERLLSEKGSATQKDYPRFPESASILKVTLPVSDILDKSSIKHIHPDSIATTKDLLSNYEIPFPEKIDPKYIKEVPFKKTETKALRQVGAGHHEDFALTLREGLVTGPYPWEKERIKKKREEYKQNAPESLRLLFNET